MTTSRGQGGPEHFRDGPGQTSDTRLMAKAIMERWPIKPEYREAIVKRLVQIVLSKESSKREVVAASKALINADKLNLPDTEINHQHLHIHNVDHPDARRADLSAIAARLGVGRVDDAIPRDSAGLNAEATAGEGTAAD